jgi:replication-associated recombination protein RarA
MGKRFSELETPNGHLVGEAASALQKSIRRGKEEDALYWASELDLTGFGNYVWKRLRIIASEDVGPADTMVAVQVRCLYENWLEQRKAEKEVPPTSQSAPLFLMHAIMALCLAPKHRMVDHAFMYFYEGDRGEIRREVPDYALDMYTRRGRSMGRGEDHFFTESTELANAARLVDPYAERGRKSRTNGSGTTDEPADDARPGARGRRRG